MNQDSHTAEVKMGSEANNEIVTQLSKRICHYALKETILAAILDLPEETAAAIYPAVMDIIKKQIEKEKGGNGGETHI